MEMVPRLRSRAKELVGSKNKGVLHNMQKVVISGTLNIFRTCTSVSSREQIS